MVLIKAVDAFRANVKVKGINCKNEYDINHIYGLNKLHECETSLPDSLELSKYPHLSEVDMYALDRQKVDILIGADFSGLMVLIDVKRDSTNIN